MSSVGPIGERGWELRVAVTLFFAGGVLAVARLLFVFGFSRIEIATGVACFCAALTLLACASVWRAWGPRWAALSAAAGIAAALASVYVAITHGAWWGIGVAAIVVLVGLLGAGEEEPAEVDEAVLEQRDAERRAAARGSADSIRPY
jgi:peptidoglycan/LPS O-acetylase OafA/YrhL